MKRTMKTILGITGGVFAALCVFVLLGAFYPEFTENLTAKIEQLQQGKKEDVSGSLNKGDRDIKTDETDNSSQPLPAVIEAEYDTRGLKNPYSEKLRYEIPDGEVKIEKKVAGLYGFLPIEEIRTKINLDLPEGEKYGETGENLSFDTRMYPYYGMLSTALQKVYQQIYANAEQLNETFVPVENLNAEQISAVMEALYNDHPELFWLDPSFTASYYENGVCREMTLHFNWTAQRLEDCMQQFTDAANDILYGAINYTEDFEKERYVHDALLGRMEYNLAAEVGQSAYSAIVNKETVCAGYARAYQYIMQRLGIPCYYCTGYAGEDHAWNIVKLGNAYYNVDVTWDDADSNSYDYFNCTDKTFAQNHVRSGLSVYLPACKGTKYQKETAGRKPNTWQNSSGNATDTSGKTYYPESNWGDGIGYDGAVLGSLEEYYDNCKSQLSKGGIGTVIFHNVVDSDTLKEIYKAYADGEYKKGYLSDTLKKLNAKEGKVTIKISVWENPDKDAGTSAGASGSGSSSGTAGNGTGNTGNAGNTGSTGSTESTDSTESGETEEDYFVEKGKEYLLTHTVVIQ